MRPVAIGAGVVALAGLAACQADLLHSTEDLTGTSAPVAQALCVDSNGDASSLAVRACAMLGACERPIGGNRAAECMMHARAAYDCTFAPGQSPRGETRAFWACLKDAATCDAVAACVHPAGRQDCSGRFAVCGTGQRGARSNARARLDCGGDGQTVGESCAAWGALCADGADGGASRCEGLDCGAYGAGRVHVAGGLSACVPAGDETCAATAHVRCEGDVAVGCLGGIVERVDCARIGATCASGEVARRVSEACRSGGVSPCRDGEQCAGGKVVSCAGGVSFTLDCGAAGLDACRMVDTADGPRAACGAR